VLEPRNGPISSTHDRWVALPYALVFRPDDHGRCRWDLRMGAATRIARARITHDDVERDP